MQRKLDVYLWEIRRFAEELLAFTRDKTLAEFKEDRALQLITERLFTIMGEAMVRLRRTYPEDYNRITNAPTVARFRNNLVHQYDRMRDEEVWRIITIRLPAMLAEINNMLDEQKL